jgi:alkyl sulfatase BDS1-like metallo-beta-lactamase superfamily hydrolase
MTTDTGSSVFAATRRHNSEIENRLPLEDTTAFDDARRGWIASLPAGGVTRADGGVVWDNDWFAFLDAPCPDSVNPSLWRHGQLNAIHGLFAVCDGVWQARACDYANMTIIRGETGWIIVDPLMTRESSAAVLALVNETLGERPVSAVVITHCHPDHFAGTRGVVGDDPARYPPIFAPEHFIRFAASEGVLGGNTMARRATYQFGIGLPIGPGGLVDGGIGKTVARGTRGFIPPTEFVSNTGETRNIDGVAFEFQMASGTEAPAEFTFYLPQHRLLCMAEVCTQNMHNLLPPRGAEVRDARLWARCIDEALILFADRTDVLINSHNWPVWDADKVAAFLAEQRDIYKYLHDQTLRLANLGYGPDEIAARIEEPVWLSQQFHARGYYGALTFNARAIYQKYFGFYDGRPVSLNPLQPSDLGARYVEALGGADKVIELAQNAILQDDLQWAATLLNHVVFGDEAPDDAKNVLASVYRNMGYRAESGIMRNCYLKGAQELAQGVQPLPAAGGRNADLAASLSLQDWFDAFALRLNPDRARGVELSLRFVVNGRVARVDVVRQVENCRTGEDARAGAVAAEMSLTQEHLEGLSAGSITLEDAIAAGATLSGDAARIDDWLKLHDSFDLWFNIVTP